MPRAAGFEGSRLHWRAESRRIDVYHTTGSDGEAARALRMAHNSFSTWRIRRNLPAKHPRPGKPVLSAAEHALRLAAYHAHPTDGEAANALAIPRPAFRTWRDAQVLPAKNPRPARINPQEETRRRRAYRESNSDEEAAALLEISLGGFKWWRQQRGLPGKGIGGPTVADRDSVSRHQAYHETFNDIEAAARLGMTQSGFQRWRAKTGLPAKTPNKGQHVTPREQAHRMRAYQAGGTDTQIAKRLGLKLATFRGWRQAQGLPAYRRPFLVAQ